MPSLSRFVICLVLCLHFAHCSHWPSRSSKGSPDSSPLAWNGTYHFNATDTDFDSHLTIRFYRNLKDSFTEWMADGTIVDHLIDQKITFKRALVTLEEDGPSVRCVHLYISPGVDDLQRKALWIDDRMHSKETPGLY